MNVLQQPIAINENSFRVNQLQVALQALGFPVAASEINSHTAGPDTLRQVRAFEQQANIPANNSVLADAATLAALAAKLKDKQITTQGNSFTVTGTVFDTAGLVAKRQPVIALNIDLKGAAAFRTITSLQAAMKGGGF